MNISCAVNIKKRKKAWYPIRTLKLGTELYQLSGIYNFSAEFREIRQKNNV